MRIILTKNKEIPMRKYKIVQTGPNIQLGGLNAGFTSPAYQIEIAEIVKTEPITPANSDNIIAITNLKKLFSFINLVY